MHVALTGTPGVGKTSVSTLLCKEGYPVFSLHEIAVKHCFFLGVDTKRNTKILDMDALDQYIQKTFVSDDIVFLEGLAAHLLSNVQKVILLRCHPQMLLKRLQNKGWGKEKIQENCEAEALDIILCETVEKFAQHDIFEIDTTKKTPHDVAQDIKTITLNKFTPIEKYNIGNIDWSEQILNLTRPDRR